MTLPISHEDREYQNFVEVAGTPHRRVTGSFKTSGLTLGGLIKEVIVDDTSWTKVPAAALINRNAVGIQNKSGFKIKYNYDSFEALPVGYVGWELENGDSTFLDITDGIDIYVKSEAGSGSITITIQEIS